MRYRILQRPDGMFIVQYRWLFLWCECEHDYGPYVYNTVAAAEQDIAHWRTARGQTTFIKEV